VYVATASDDHSVLLWDLRKRLSFYTLPAHLNLISNVRFQPGLGSFLMTSSYDKTIKLFSCQDWSLTHTLTGHEAMVTRAEIAPSTPFLFSLS
jgi:U4/U6 small nuclear ribonucleoprotein PRP4